MDIWQRAKSFAEEAAKRSRSFSESAKIADLVSETAKISKDLAAQGSKRADQIKLAALQQADHIRSLSLAHSSPATCSSSDFQRFGLTEDLRDFVKGISASTFLNFPVQETSDVPTVSNVRQDLTEWKVKHATLVLTTVKEISKLRYELCPRHMNESKFWRIYFTLVNSHVASYERKYMEEVKLKEAEQIKDDNGRQTLTGKESNKSEGEKSLKHKTSSSGSAEQDLDTFLLGDLEDSDEAPDDGDGIFTDDFDKIDNSDFEDEKHLKK